MIRFGSSELFHPSIRDNKFAKLFLNIFGNVDTGSSHFHFIKMAKNLILPDKACVLDAGCGKGKYSFWLLKTYPTLKMDACDLSKKEIAHCNEIQKRMGTNCNFFVQDLMSFKKPNAYDFIF